MHAQSDDDELGGCAYLAERDVHYAADDDAIDGAVTGDVTTDGRRSEQTRGAQTDSCRDGVGESRTRIAVNGPPQIAVRATKAASFQKIN